MILKCNLTSYQLVALLSNNFVIVQYLDLACIQAQKTMKENVALKVTLKRLERKNHILFYFILSSIVDEHERESSSSR